MHAVQFKTHFIFIWLSLLVTPVATAEVLTCVFAVKQSGGLGLSAGDEVTVRLSYTPETAGVEGRGMAGSPEIRFAGAVTKVTIDAKSTTMKFPGSFDVIVMPLRNQWMVGRLTQGIAETAAARLDTFSLILTYPPDVLPLDSPVPPDGVMLASDAGANRMGIDLMADGELEDSGEAWAIFGELVSFARN